MALAENEKLNLLREHRLSEEKFYYQLALLSGGTASLFVSLLGIQPDLVKHLSLYERWTFILSVALIAFTFIFSIVRNFLALSHVKAVAGDVAITEYNQVIGAFSKEGGSVKLFSVSCVLAYILGVFLFGLVVITGILK